MVGQRHIPAAGSDNGNCEIDGDHRKLGRDEVILTYRLFLGRRPSNDEVGRMTQNASDLERLRRIFIGSREFLHVFRELGRRDIGFRPTLVHLHIPKTGGSSLNVALNRSCAPGEYLAIGHETMNELRNMDGTELKNVKVVAGHTLYGVDRLLPQPSVYLCLLRSPGARILSFYRFVLRTATHPLHEECRCRNISFGDFLRLANDNPGLRAELDNGQIRRISGLFGSDGFGREAEIFEQAMVNIFANNMVFGLTDHLDDFVLRLREMGFISDTTPVRSNTSPEATDIDQEKRLLRARERKLFDRYTEWDRKFYDLCAKVYLHTAGEMRRSP